MAEKQHRGNQKGSKLRTRPLPSATMRKLLFSSLGGDKQLSHEAVQLATDFWENEIKSWVGDYLLQELEQANSNVNRTKPKSYKYRRLTGLMVARAIQKFTRRECNDG